eukprot:5932351-Alexandrium_andersonii.AAC.1
MASCLWRASCSTLDASSLAVMTALGHTVVPGTICANTSPKRACPARLCTASKRHCSSLPHCSP